MTAPEHQGEYLRRLRRALSGEVFGESFFGELARSSRDPQQRAILETLAELEHRMRMTLEDAATRAGIPIPVDASAADRGAAAAAAIAHEPWHALLDRFKAATDDALEGYRKLKAVAPDPDAPELVLLLAHEDALREFARLALEDAPDCVAPVSSVISSLGHRRSHDR